MRASSPGERTANRAVLPRTGWSCRLLKATKATPMKPNLVTFARSPSSARAFRCRAAALITTVAISACMAIRLDAVIIDDFEGPVRYVSGWWGTNSVPPSLINGQLVFAGQFTGPTPPNAPWTHIDNVGWPNCLPGVIPERHTLEVRMDFISASIDDAFLLFEVETPGGAGYAVTVDQNEVALWKYGGNIALPFWTSTPCTNQDVTVGVALTRMTNTLQITTRVVDKTTGHLLFERSFLDGPGSDCVVPVPPPKGMTFFGADPGAPYTNFSAVYAGVFQWTTTNPPPVEVVVDNLEYDVYHPPHLEIAPGTNGVGLNWLLPLEEHIVVTVDQLSGPWRPGWQPPTRAGDVFCLTLPCTEAQKFFRLTPGRQFTDDFSILVPTWTPFFQEAGEDWFVTNGVLQMIKTANASLGFGLAPLGTNAAATLRDCCASVDIVDWASSGNNSSDFALGGRGRFVSSTYAQGYFGFLTLNADGVPGRVRPWIHTPSGDTYGTAFDVQQFPLPYRLQFSAVGTQISLRVLNPATGQLIQPVSSSPSTLPDGFTGVWLQGGGNAGETNRISLDNFFVSGTKP
jgi:hypothetical protein